MKRSILILFLFIGVVAASLAFINADTPQYKNLKVLNKNISKHDLDSVMDFFKISLGEKCGFCHARNEATNSMDFASDANPHKNTARFMMHMTAKINKKYFKDHDKDEDHSSGIIQAVTCYTCHHGEGSPETKPSKVKKENTTMPNNFRPSANDSLKKSVPDSSHAH